MGHLVEVNGEEGFRIISKYDLRGRLTARTNGLNQTISYTYNEASDLTQITGLNGNFVTLERDPQGRLRLYGYGGYYLQFDYDEAGRPVRLINENGACATFEYDVMDRLSKQVNFDGRTQHYDFNAMGDIIRTEDEGLVSFYYYDKGGRLIRRKIGEGDQAPTEYFSYNEAGQLVKAWHTIIGSATFTTEFRLDKLGRITQESQNIIDNKNESVWNYSVNREFDELGIESHTTYTGLPIITWQTYGSGHLHGVMLDDRSLVAFERDKRHRETRREFGRTQGVRTYDSLSRLLFQDIHSDLIDEKNSLKRQHYYDVAGQLVRIETAKGVNEYCYDKSGRLIAFRQPGLLEQSYRFDPAGNRLFESQTTIAPNDHWEEAVRQHMHDNSFNLLGSNGARDIHETAFKWMDNRIKDDGEYHYEYDAWGNLRRKYKVEGNEKHRYNYDSNHRLMRYELESDTQVRGANYYYDTFGRRIAKQVQNADSKGNLLGDIETTFFGWDGDRLVLTEKDAHQIHTIYEPGSFVPMIRVAGEKAPPKRTLVQQLQNYQGIVLDQKSRVFFDELEQELRKNQLSAKTEKWIQQVDMQPWALKALLDEESFAVMKQIHMFQCDHLGTPIALINEQGEIDWSAELDAWGQPISENNPDLLYQAIGFQGQHLDSESGLYYNRHRYYHAQVGRYISQDPIGLNGGVNNFAYVEGNPIRYVDPMGLEKWDWNGKGDTSICGYYDTMSSSHPKCSYYKAASDICRGNNGLVNTAVNSGITAAWTAGSTSDSQATILEKIRKSLVASDKKARSEGRVDCNTDCVYGDDIDEYHNEAFNNAGLSKNFYGGNLWPQGVWPNPVPYDKRRLMDSLPKGPVEMPTWE